MVDLESEIERFEAAVGKSEHMPGYVHTFHDKEIPCCASTFTTPDCKCTIPVSCGCLFGSNFPIVHRATLDDSS